MADSVKSQRLYHFDELLNSFWNWRLFHRVPPGGPLKVTRTNIFLIAAVISLLQVCFLVIKFLEYLRAKPIDWDVVMEATALLFSISIAFFQGLSHILKRRVLERLMANLEKIFPQTRAEQEEHNLEPYASELIQRRNFVDKLSRFSAFAFVSLPLLFSLYEWLVLGKDFPFYYQFRSWYPVNPRTWLSYPFLYLFEVIISYLYGFHLINDYVFYAFATGQMQMHYRNLGRMVSQMDAKQEELNKYSNFGRLVDYHCALDKLRDDINEVFNVTTFISFGFTKLSICMVMYTILRGNNLMVLPTLVAVFFLLLLLVYMRCSNGAALYTASEELVNMIYDNNWYEGSPRYRRMLVFMMARANRPVELHALKTTKIQMETFKEIILEAYQIFMFLLNFSEH